MLKSLALAIALLYGAADNVQSAIDSDVCQNDSLVEVTAARGAMKGADLKAYDKILKALGKAYEKVPPTDGELERVRVRFCRAVDNR